MFRLIWSSSGASKLMLEIASLPSMNTIQKYALVHASMCGTLQLGIIHTDLSVAVSNINFEAPDDDHISRNM
jgi:hypothetical protein